MTINRFASKHNSHSFIHCRIYGEITFQLCVHNVAVVIIDDVAASVVAIATNRIGEDDAMGLWRFEICVSGRDATPHASTAWCIATIHSKSQLKCFRIIYLCHRAIGIITIFVCVTNELHVHPLRENRKTSNDSLPINRINILDRSASWTLCFSRLLANRKRSCVLHIGKSEIFPSIFPPFSAPQWLISEQQHQRQQQNREKTETNERKE